MEPKPNETAGPGGTGARVHAWYWARDARRRTGPSWLGLFLVILGGLLLLEQLVPAARDAGAIVVLAVGLAFLASWAVSRRVAALYAGAILTAIALPDALSATGLISGPGWGTLSVGLAFVLIATVRASSRGGIGWQAWLGGILVAVGGTEIADGSTGRLLWPALLVVIGILVLARGWGRRAF